MSMMSKDGGGSKQDVALDTLRLRICLAPRDVELRLHETVLAAEFEMSRTPIRQVLQRLAYERLVETRSGVGTIAVPMRIEDRARDSLTHQGLIRAVLAHKFAPLTLLDQSRISALASIAERAEAFDAEFLFGLRTELLAVLQRQIVDPILRDAFNASHWRALRWTIADFADDEDAGATAARELVQRANERAALGAAQVFEALLELAKSEA